MNKKAFSILEASIAILIIAVIAVVSITMYTTLIKSTKLKTTARGIASTLRLARAYAITDNKDCYVAFRDDETPQRYYISDDGVTVSADTKVYWMPEGIYFEDPTQFGHGVEVTQGGYGNAAHFTPTGALNEAGAALEYNIYVADSNADPNAHSYRISVQRITGSVQVHVHQ